MIRSVILAAALLSALLAGCGTATPEPAAAPGAALFIITDATLIDGTGAPARPADVRVRGARIVEVGELTPRPGERVLDAAGLALAPGFIDTHSHHDRGLLDMPDALAAVSQGITTIIAGQDGGSQLPLGDFFRDVEETGVAVNVASYVGHGTVRRHVMGRDFRREATPAEIDEMRRVLRRELAAGALGLSTGLEYDPGIYSSTEEVITLAREAAAVGGRYISHMRSEDRELFDAVEELIRIGREADIPVQVSHMKLAMRSLWGRADELIERLDRARAAGIDVTADVYPYPYWQSTMTVLFPDRNFEDRAAFEFALTELVAPEDMLIARYEAEPRYAGRTLADVAAERGEDPVDTYMALIARAEAEDAGESIIATSMSDDDIVRMLRWPHTNVSSDGALAGAHPRGFGAFTRVLGPYVREGHLGLEEAVHKMSGLPAAHTGIEGRGVIRPGAFADLVLFDPATVADRATPQSPRQLSSGIARVWVNGAVVYEAGETTGARPGRIVRRSTPAIDAVFADYDTDHTPGCALGVFRDGEIAYARGYGMASLEHDVPLTPSSVFRIGSVSKQFTAAAMALLEQDGVLSLDDPVTKWIPELPDFGPDVTLRRMIHHTSGIRDYLTLMTLAGLRNDDWYSDDEVLAMLARQTSLNFDPGSDHLYSNGGYFLLSQVVKRATGKTLAEYARARMFEPLGMRDTHFHDDPTRIVPRRAVGHAPTRDGGYRISTTTLPMIGDGGIFTSIEELLLWDRNLDDGATVGGPAFVETMHSRGVLDSGDTIAYAFGLAHGDHRGLRVVGHGGAFVGFRAASLRYPDERVAVYILCNRADADPTRLSARLGEIVLADRMTPATAASADAPRRQERVDTLTFQPARLAEYEGRYHADELDATYRIRLRDGTLHLEMGRVLDGPLDGPLAAIDRDVFRRGPLTLHFRRDAGRVTGFEIEAGRVRGILFVRDPSGR